MTRTPYDLPHALAAETARAGERIRLQRDDVVELDDEALVVGRMTIARQLADGRMQVTRSRLLDMARRQAEGGWVLIVDDAHRDPVLLNCR